MADNEENMSEVPDAPAGASGRLLGTMVGGLARKWSTDLFRSRFGARELKSGSYTLTSADERKIIVMNSTSNTTVTLPTHASDPIPVGAWFVIGRSSSGEVSIGTPSGVFYSPDDRDRLRGIGCHAIVIKVTENFWIGIGDLKA